MATTPKTLGQIIPAANTLTAVYTVPSATNTISSSIIVCNQSTATTFSISVAVGGASDTAKQYLFSAVPIGANTTLTITIGITLAATDVVRCLSASGSVSFNLFGSELS